jgi:hypothetical protein
VGIKKIKTIRVKLDSRTFIDIRYIDLVNSVAEVYCKANDRHGEGHSRTGCSHGDAADSITIFSPPV